MGKKNKKKISVIDVIDDYNNFAEGIGEKIGKTIKKDTISVAKSGVKATKDTAIDLKNKAQGKNKTSVKNILLNNAGTVTDALGETKAIKTGANVATNMGKGAMKSLEGILDFANDASTAVNTNTTAAVMKLMGKSDKEIKDFKKKENENNKKFVQKDLTNKFTEKTGYNDIQKDLEKGSLVKESNLGGQISQGVGGMVPSLVAGQVLGGGTAVDSANQTLKGLKGLDLAKQVGTNVATNLAVNAAPNAVLATSAYGNALADAYNSGAKISDARKYAAGSAATEFLTEMITGGIPGLESSTGVLDNLADKGINTATKGIKNDLTRNVVKGGLNLAKTGLGEGVEEGLSAIIDPYLKNATYSKGEKVNWKDAGQEALVGGLTGILLGGAGDISNARQQYKTDVAQTQLTNIKESAKNEVINNVNSGVMTPQEGMQALQQIKNMDTNTVQQEQNNIIAEQKVQEIEAKRKSGEITTQEAQQELQAVSNVLAQRNAQINKQNKFVNNLEINKDTLQNNNQQVQQNVQQNMNKEVATNDNTNTTNNNIDTTNENTLKNKQLEIINKTNPMRDEYHTGIRNENDIKTFDEVLNDEESFAWGDYSKKDAQRDLEKGTVTIYSSKPIENGNFVSTSKIQAEEYAGGRGKKVYSKEVPINDVAWVNGDEGQYAKVENNTQIPTSNEQNNVNNQIVQQEQNTPKMAQNDAINNEQEIIGEAPKILDKVPKNETSLNDKIKNRIDTTLRETIDKGKTIYDLSRKTGNKKLYSDYDRIAVAGNEATSHISNGQADLNGKQYTNFKDALGNNKKMSIIDIWEDANASGISDITLQTYLVNKLNMNRLENGVEQFTNMPYETSEQIVKDIETSNKDIKRVSENIYTYYRNQLQNMVDGGLISKKVANEFITKYPNYVRIQRNVNGGGNNSLSVKNGKIEVNNQIQKVKGGYLDIMPLKETMAKYTLDVTNAIRVNKFGQELLNTMNVDNTNGNRDIQAVDESFGINPELLNFDKNSKLGTFTIFKDGVATVVPIDKGIYDALDTTPIKDIPYLSLPAKVQRALITEKNPLFIPTNAVKDFSDIGLNSKYPIKTYKNFFQLASTYDINPYVKLYKGLGGEQNSVFRNGEFTNNINNDSKIKNAINKVENAKLNPINMISKANNVIESLPRIAEFKSTIEANGYLLDSNGELVENTKSKIKNKKSVDEVLSEAMYNAADVTTNFKRGGKFTKTLNKNGFNFLNASVQGFDKQVRNVTEPFINRNKKEIAQLFGKVLAFGILPSLFNDLVLSDDEEYQDLPDYIKDNYYLIKQDDGKFIRIPKGRAVSVYGSAARRTSDKLKGGEFGVVDYLSNTAQQIGPSNPLDNNILSPITSVGTNTSWSGNKIVNDYLQKLPDAEQYDSSTSEIAKTIGKTLNYSPKKIDYLIDQYTGGIGDVLQPATKQYSGNKNNTGISALINPLKDKFTTDSVTKSKTTSDYYELKKNIEKSSNSSKATDLDKVKYKYIGGSYGNEGEEAQELSALYKEQREIKSNTKLSSEEKYKQVRDKQKEINKKIKEMTNALNNAKQDGDFITIGNTLYQKYEEDGETKYRKTDKKIANSIISDAEEQARYYELDDEQKNKFYKNVFSYSNAKSKSDKTGEEISSTYRKAYEQSKHGYSIADYYLDKATKETKETSKTDYDTAYSRLEDKGIDTKTYERFREFINNVKSDYNSNGKVIKNSKKNKIINYINGLNLTYEQKNALYEDYKDYQGTTTYYSYGAKK